LRERPRSLLGTILVANNFINIAIVVISEFLIWNLFSEELFEQWAQVIVDSLGIAVLGATTMARVINFLITIFGITFLLVLFGEIAPKIYSRIHNKTMAGFMSIPLTWLMRIFNPLTSGLVLMSNSVENALSKRGGGRSASKEDLDKAIELTVIDEEDAKEEADILKGIIKFNDITVKQIMRNRVDVLGLDFKTPYPEVIHTIKSSGYSRLPVFEEDFDNILGILYVKDVIAHFDEEPKFEWQNLMRNEVLYVPETKKINELLKEFQSRRMHMAIVVDEYGGSSGIVTLEDVMEEVIGEIKDESDMGEEQDYVKVDDDNYIFDGKVQINDVCRIMDIDSDELEPYRGESDTIAGLILESHGFIPKKDQEFIIADKYKLRAVDVGKRRIQKVQITIL
ncbi:MAG: gliding motility-associated protein GldE, partial [Saprospiraceae bacterium]|nr:gliding motility-associated protein GldE [Saprospiraceae bacterium]